jgi:hypothetical protein
MDGQKSCQLITACNAETHDPAWVSVPDHRMPPVITNRTKLHPSGPRERKPRSQDSIAAVIAGQRNAIHAR